LARPALAVEQQLAAVYEAAPAGARVRQGEAGAAEAGVVRSLGLRQAEVVARVELAARVLGLLGALEWLALPRQQILLLKLTNTIFKSDKNSPVKDMQR
jgi:hypothetical protein